MGLTRALGDVYGYWGSDTERSNRTGRRNRVARFSGSRTGETNVLYQSESAQWDHLDRLAYAAAVLRRLQRWDQPMVRRRLFYDLRRFPQRHIDMA